MFQRILSWMANELITKKLAQSESFQRFAAKTHETVQHVGKKIPGSGSTAREESRRINPYRIAEFHSRPRREEPTPMQAMKLGVFMKAFKENIEKEIQKNVDRKLKKM